MFKIGKTLNVDESLTATDKIAMEAAKAFHENSALRDAAACFGGLDAAMKAAAEFDSISAMKAATHYDPQAAMKAEATAIRDQLSGKAAADALLSAGRVSSIEEMQRQQAQELVRSLAPITIADFLKAQEQERIDELCKLQRLGGDRSVLDDMIRARPDAMLGTSVASLAEAWKAEEQARLETLIGFQRTGDYRSMLDSAILHASETLKIVNQATSGWDQFDAGKEITEAAKAAIGIAPLAYDFDRFYQEQIALSRTRATMAKALFAAAEAEDEDAADEILSASEFGPAVVFALVQQVRHSRSARSKAKLRREDAEETDLVAKLSKVLVQRDEAVSKCAEAEARVKEKAEECEELKAALAKIYGGSGSRGDAIDKSKVIAWIQENKIEVCNIAELIERNDWPCLSKDYKPDAIKRWYKEAMPDVKLKGGAPKKAKNK